MLKSWHCKIVQILASPRLLPPRFFHTLGRLLSFISFLPSFFFVLSLSPPFLFLFLSVSLSPDRRREQNVKCIFCWFVYKFIPTYGVFHTYIAFSPIYNCQLLILPFFFIYHFLQQQQQQQQKKCPCVHTHTCPKNKNPVLCYFFYIIFFSFSLVSCFASFPFAHSPSVQLLCHWTF